MTETKFKPVTINVFLGAVEEAQARRTAYDKVADKKGKKTSAWAREVLDREARFKWQRKL